MEGIDENSLEFLVNALTELILNEDMAGKLKGEIVPNALQNILCLVCIFNIILPT